MTEEVTTETPETTEEVQPVETPKPEPTKSEAELHKEKQGERKFKKKTKRFTKDECLSELHRLERTGHQQSKYYGDIQSRLAEVS